MKNVQESKDIKKAKDAAGEDKRAVRARQRAIGRELRRFYDGVAEEPVPDDFLELLQRIEARPSDDGEDSETP